MLHFVQHDQRRQSVPFCVPPPGGMARLRMADLIRMGFKCVRPAPDGSWTTDKGRHLRQYLTTALNYAVVGDMRGISPPLICPSPTTRLPCTWMSCPTRRHRSCPIV